MNSVLKERKLGLLPLRLEETLCMLLERKGQTEGVAYLVGKRLNA
jgi:hypothetical protein